MLYLRSLKSLLVLSSLFVTSSVNAFLLESELQSLGGNQFQYSYTATNNSLASGVSEFAVYFDKSLYQNLQVVQSPVDWDSIVLQPDEFLDGIFDSLALSQNLALGESLSGFVVSFEWLGQSAPGSQMFEVIDPLTFEVVEQGDSRVVSDVSPVSEPSALQLAIVALLMLFGRFKRKIIR